MLNWIKDNPIFFLLIFLAVVSPTFFFGAVQVIFYIIFGIIILMLILGLVFRAKIRQLQKQAEEQMGGAGTGAQNGGGFYSFNRGYSRQGGSKQREGDVNIVQDGSNEKKVAKDVGDYVDFEEVKEK